MPLPLCLMFLLALLSLIFLVPSVLLLSFDLGVPGAASRSWKGLVPSCPEKWLSQRKFPNRPRDKSLDYS